MDLHESQMRSADDRAQALRDAYQLGSRSYQRRVDRSDRSNPGKGLGDYSYFDYAEARLTVVEDSIKHIEEVIPVLDELRREREALMAIVANKPVPATEDPTPATTVPDNIPVAR